MDKFSHFSILCPLASGSIHYYTNLLRPPNSKQDHRFPRKCFLLCSHLLREFLLILLTFHYSSLLHILRRCVNHIYPTDSLDSTLFHPFHSMYFIQKAVLSPHTQSFTLALRPATLLIVAWISKSNLCQNFGPLHALEGY